MEEIIANNDEHTLPQIKQCTCMYDMKLELKEDTIGNVSYQYECTLKMCGKVDKVEV